MPPHGAIWTIIELEDIMVLNNVTKFHKILIKTIVDIVGVSYGCTDRQVDRGITLSCKGHKNIARIIRALAAYLQVVRRRKPSSAEGTRGEIIPPLVRGVWGPHPEKIFEF